jgi:hypothetical protein
MRSRTKVKSLPFDSATVSRMLPGKLVLTDGPFTETKEVFGGRWPRSGIGVQTWDGLEEERPHVGVVRRHISPFEISRVRTLGQREQKVGAKPKGLWYDLDGEWERWCRDQGTRWVEPESVRYRLKLDHSADSIVDAIGQ